MRIHVQTAGGSHCEVVPCDQWTCHDLKVEIQNQLDVPVAQQRLIYNGSLLNEHIGVGSTATIGDVLGLDTGQNVLVGILL